jgi:hypothetical protein
MLGSFHLRLQIWQAAIALKLEASSLPSPGDAAGSGSNGEGGLSQALGTSLPPRTRNASAAEVGSGFARACKARWTLNYRHRIPYDLLYDSKICQRNEVLTNEVF